MKAIIVSVSVVLAFSISSFAQEMTSEEIIQHIVDSFEQQMKDVNDVTIISEASEGQEAGRARTEIEYRKKAQVNGKTIYKRREELNNEEDITIYDGEYEWEWHAGGEVTKNEVDFDPSAMISEELLKSMAAEYIGTEEIDGNTTYILQLKNMIDFIWLSPEEKNMVSEVNGRSWFDSEDWVIRRMEMEIRSTRGNMHTVTNYNDYRNMNGMLIPYQTTTKTSLEINPEMIKKQLQEVPAEYRAQVEAQIKAQMGREEIRITQVQEVEVNTGLSDNLFEGSELGM